MNLVSSSNQQRQPIVLISAMRSFISMFLLNEMEKISRDQRAPGRMSANVKNPNEKLTTERWRWDNQMNEKIIKK